MVLGLKGTSRICRWEKGSCIPNTINVFKLALLYGVLADALFADLRRVLKEEIRAREEKILRASKDT